MNILMARVSFFRRIKLVNASYRRIRIKQQSNGIDGFARKVFSTKYVASNTAYQKENNNSGIQRVLSLLFRLFNRRLQIINAGIQVSCTNN